MSFTESLKVEIESVFDSVGFKKLNQQIKKTKAQFAGMNSLMARARGLSNMREQSQDLQRRLDRTAFSFQSVNDSVKNMSVSQLANGFGGFNGELKNNQQLAARAKQQIDELGGVVRDSEGNIARIGNVVGALSEQFDTTLGGLGLSENVQASNKELEKLQVRSNSVREAFSDGLFGEKTGRGMPGFDPQQFQMPDMGRMGIGVAASELGVLGAEAGQVNDVTTKSNGVFQRFGRRVKGASSMISGDMLPSLQSLQMTLLGVQFQLLSLAFIFGGLMGSALGAVGVFKILGNTLKMFFLPTALEILPIVLDIRDALLGVDKDTRKTIGRIFAFIAAISALGSIIAFVVNGFLAFLTPLTPLIKGFMGLLRVLGPTKSLLGGLKVAASAVGSAFTKFFALFTKIIPGLSKVVLGTAGTILSFFAGLAGAFLAVVTVAKRFGKKVALAFGLVLAAIGVVVAAIASAPLVIAAAIGVIVGAILGLLWTFKDTVMGIFMGIVKFAIRSWMIMFQGILDIFKGVIKMIQGFVSAIVAFLMGDFDRAWKFLKEGFNGLVKFLQGIVKLLIAPFVQVYNKLVGNSIFPDLVRGIIKWLFKLPSAAFNAATGIVNQIIKGIKGVGSGIWDAFKSVLPDFVVDALAGTGQAIASGVNAVAGFASSGVNAVSNFANQAGSFVSGINPFGGNNNGGKTEVQNNTINAQVEVNDKEETPQETGRQLGQGLTDGMNSRQSDVASGS